MSDAHYSKKRKTGDANKLFCNESVMKCYEKYVNAHEGDVVLLDDRNFQSTKAMLPQFCELNVFIAQHDKEEYKRMCSKQMRCTLIHDDYSRLNPRKNKVVLDNADFCCGWEKIKHIMFDRLKTPSFYATKAIVRVTVSSRGSKMNADKFANHVLHEYAFAAIDTVYCVKPLTIRQWCDDQHSMYGFDQDDGDATCFTYSPFMTTFIFLLVKLT